MIIKCLICNEEFGQITGKHLFYKHNIKTVDEYLQLYPDAITTRPRKDSEETLAKKRKARLGYKHDQKTKDKIGAKHKGKKRSVEEIDKWKISYRKYLDENGSPMIGKDRGEEFKKKMREIAKNRPKELVDSKVKMMIDARKGSKATPEQRERYSAARLKYIADNPDSLPKTLFNTKPEREFAEELDKRNISYKKNVMIGGKLFDFKINNDILVEIDGPYHYQIHMYGSKVTPIIEKQKLFNITIDRDKLKNQIAIDNNLKLFRIKVEGDLPSDWLDQLKEQGWNLF